MKITKERLNEMKELARRDDCLTAFDGFVPSDIRELIAEIESIHKVMDYVANIDMDFTDK